MVSLIITDKSMHSIVVEKVAEVPENYKILFHLMRILRKPAHLSRNSYLHVQLLGDAHQYEIADLEINDIMFCNVFSVTVVPSPTKNKNALRFERSDFLTRGHIITDSYRVSRHEWATIFGADITDVVLTYKGWYKNDIDNIIAGIKAILDSCGYQNISYHAKQVRNRETFFPR